MLDFLAKGGVLVIPILLCSVIALAIFVERIIRFSRIKNHGADLADKAVQLVKDGRKKEALQELGAGNAPMGRVLLQAIDVVDQGRDTLETVISHSTDEEIRDLSTYVQALATMGNIAPLLGLLGTVVGMIKAFMVIQQMGGKVNAAVLAGGIWEAMLTTALGLAVALPTMVAHSYLLSRIDKYEASLQSGAVAFLKGIGKQRDQGE
jgi:biopolymer transport protein ExbB